MARRVLPLVVAGVVAVGLVVAVRAFVAGGDTDPRPGPIARAVPS
ncbi:MAG: hypothetical protein AB7J32_07385 [Pseudonocardia sp.]